MPKLPSGLKTFEASDTVRRSAQNENIEAMDALFHTSTGHRHTGRAGDAPQIGKEGIAAGAIITDKMVDGAVETDKLADGAVNGTKIAQRSIERKHLENSNLSSNIAKFKRVSVTEGVLMGNPTSPFTFEGGSAGDSNYWSLSQGTTLPHSLTIDLGKGFQTIEGMSFGSRTGGMGRRTIPKGFYVETSNDGARWTRVYTQTEGFYEPFSYIPFSVSATNSRYVRITITEHNALAMESALSCIAVYSGYHGHVDDPLEDERAWGLTARLQGLMIVPEGMIMDNGAGTLTLSGAVSIMNPASGTYFRVKSGVFTLDRWSYLYVDIPHQHGVLVDPYIAAWAPGIRSFDKRDRIILAQRNGGNEIFLHAAMHSKLAGTNPNADKVDGIDFQIKNGALEYNGGLGWKGVGIKSVQRGSTQISYFYPNGNGSLMKDITITAVNPQKSFVHITTSGLAHWFQSSPMMDGSVCARIIASDKLRFNFMEGFFEGYAEISWEVIEFA